MELPKIPFKLNSTAILAAICALIVAGELLLGNGGCIEVEPGEVAVIYNNTGLGIFGDRQRTVVEQGALTFLPGIHTVQVLERKPQVFVMAADQSGAYRGASSSDGTELNFAPQLTVRANDGSNFYFDRLEIHFQIDPPQAARVIETSGKGEGYKEQLIGTHAREILRDEFGRYDFLEIANPGTYGAATAEAKKRLNERLTDYGVQVTQIVTPKPK